MVKCKKIEEAFRYGDAKAPPRFFMAFGPDAGMVRAAIAKLSATLLNHAPNIEIRRFSDADLAADFGSFESAITSASLFGGANLGVVRLQNDAQSSKLVALLEKMENDNAQISGACYIECGDFSLKSKLVQAFEASKIAGCLRLFAPNRADFVKIINDLAQRENVAIDKDAIDIILASSAQDSDAIEADVINYALYVGKGGKIDVAAVSALSNYGREAKIEEVILAAFAGELQNTLIWSHQCLNGGANSIAIIGAILRRIKLLLLLRSENDAGRAVGEIINDKKFGIFWKEQDAIGRQIPIWTRAALESVLTRVIETDIACKQKGANTEILLERALIGIAEFAAKKAIRR